MAEHVTQVDIVKGAKPADVRRLRAFADRLGRDGVVRSRDARDAEATFDLLVAAKPRLPITAVRRHLCRHDEGIGDCSSEPLVVG